MAITIVLAPRAFTSSIFPLVWLATTGSLNKAITGVPSSIKAIVPCFNSPAAKLSVCTYEISFNFNAASIAT